MSLKKFTVKPKDLVCTEIIPDSTKMVNDGTLFIDFKKAAFGTLLISLPESYKSDYLVVHLGEKLNNNGRIDRNPPGSIRYCRIKQHIDRTLKTIRIKIPVDERNTGPAAIRMPDDIGEVFPFRYAEIEDAGSCDHWKIRQLTVHYPFKDKASFFNSSSTILNAVWDICKYSIKATTYCGVYVDGDRERIPYEADAYINQLGHYCIDSEYALARYTHEYLLQYPTWPTEWQIHSIMMAWEDYMYTGETLSLKIFYKDLCVKTLIGLAREDGLISTYSDRNTKEFELKLHLHHSRYIFNHGLKDLVDWPPGSFTEGAQGERDNYEMMPVNTVVNAFHYRGLVLMARIASALGYEEDHRRFKDRSNQVLKTFHRIFFMGDRGVYKDGEGSNHASLHSNMFALAFNLVPEEYQKSVVSFVASKGMACSVYGSQYLLEALYKNDKENYAFDLLTSKNDRSWWNMIREGSTITMEAWALKYKNNLDWNHAWGAVPANIIPRFLMGIRPLEPGFTKVLIQPRPGNLESSEMKFPTKFGTISVRFRQQLEESFFMDVDIPSGISACIHLPLPGKGKSEVLFNGLPMNDLFEGKILIFNNLGSGKYSFQSSNIKK